MWFRVGGGRAGAQLMLPLLQLVDDDGDNVIHALHHSHYRRKQNKKREKERQTKPCRIADAREFKQINGFDSCNDTAAQRAHPCFIAHFLQVRKRPPVACSPWVTRQAQSQTHSALTPRTHLRQLLPQRRHFFDVVVHRVHIIPAVRRGATSERGNAGGAQPRNVGHGQINKAHIFARNHLVSAK